MVNQNLLASRAREDFVGFLLISFFAYIAAFTKAFIFDQYGLSLFSNWSDHSIPLIKRLIDNFGIIGLASAPVYSLIVGGIFGFTISYSVVSLIDDPIAHPFEQIGGREALQIRAIRTTIFLFIFLSCIAMTFLIPYAVFHIFYL